MGEVRGGFREWVGAYLAGIEEWGVMMVVESKGAWRGRPGMVVNAHIPQHEGRGTARWVGDAVVEVEGGGGNTKREIITQVTRVMICHTTLN